MSDSAVCEHTQQDADKDLVAWIGERRAERHCPAQLFNAMRASGWSSDDAVAGNAVFFAYEMLDEPST